MRAGIHAAVAALAVAFAGDAHAAAWWCAVSGGAGGVTYVSDVRVSATDLSHARLRMLGSRFVRTVDAAYSEQIDTNASVCRAYPAVPAASFARQTLMANVTAGGGRVITVGVF